MDKLNKIPQGPADGNAVYFITVTRNIAGVPTEVYVPTSYDADMPSYVATVVNSALAANKNHASLVNKIGSGKTVRVQHIYAYPTLAAAVTGLQVTLEVHGVTATGPTAGTVLTMRNYDTGDGPVSANIEARSNPTATPLANWVLTGGTVNTEETASKEAQQTLFKKEGNVSSLILREGEGILIKQTALAGGGNINIHIVFQVD
jgi:hypothetical protein